MITRPVSLDAARRARSDDADPAVIRFTVRPQTIFKARKMMVGPANSRNSTSKGQPRSELIFKNS
ncbi:Uncharacterized protein APZ42_013029 [Daphnia magna]|uniref:Uncharacterized protein n=1 Tax=Daphnia magna TaxID=35525 RepID=A0A162R8S3_9CRUS|nr:Uncharacterized protein APZ42_013029 [Daphnia magna]